MPPSHKCPIHGCSKKVPYEMLMCANHYRMLPTSLRRKLWAEYRGGAGQGSAEHIAISAECVRHVDQQLDKAKQESEPKQRHVRNA